MLPTAFYVSGCKISTDFWYKAVVFKFISEYKLWDKPVFVLLTATHFTFNTLKLYI